MNNTEPFQAPFELFIDDGCSLMKACIFYNSLFSKLAFYRSKLCHSFNISFLLQTKDIQCTLLLSFSGESRHFGSAGRKQEAKQKTRPRNLLHPAAGRGLALVRPRRRPARCLQRTRWSEQPDDSTSPPRCPSNSDRDGGKNSSTVHRNPGSGRETRLSSWARAARQPGLSRHRHSKVQKLQGAALRRRIRLVVRAADSASRRQQPLHVVSDHETGPRSHETPSRNFVVDVFGSAEQSAAVLHAMSGDWRHHAGSPVYHLQEVVPRQMSGKKQLVCLLLRF